MVLCDICGDEFKNDHGLRIHKSQTHGENGVRPKPDDVDLPEDKNWSDLTPYQRYYYQNHEEERERSRNRRDKLSKWFKDLKDDLSCNRCSEDRPECLDFHHTGEKEMCVSEMVRDGWSKDRIMDEIARCEVICANCHRIEHNRKV